MLLSRRLTLCFDPGSHRFSGFLASACRIGNVAVAKGYLGRRTQEISIVGTRAISSQSGSVAYATGLLDQRVQETSIAETQAIGSRLSPLLLLLLLLHIVPAAAAAAAAIFPVLA